jgi:hypothetical protein
MGCNISPRWGLEVRHTGTRTGETGFALREGSRPPPETKLVSGATLNSLPETNLVYINRI